MIGGLSKASTSILRQLIDAGTLANLPAGFKTRGIRIRDEDTPIQPGEFRDVDAPGGSLRESIQPLPFKEPSNTLLNLLGILVNAGQKFAAISEINVGQGNPNAPVGTTLALLERSTKVLSAIHKRLHNSQKKEFRILSSVFKEYLPEEYPYNVANANNTIKLADFDDRVDIFPVSNPDIFSQSQRIAMAQEMMQLVQSNPEVHGPSGIYESYKRMYAAIGVDNTEQITQWVFVANEGNFGASNGSISMINNNDEVYHVEEVGDVVQSLEVYEDKLIVVVNNSHMIKVYDITENGLRLPGIEISTNNSSPRELVVIDDKVYFTNWNTKDVKVLNLFNYNIETSISVDGLPESIVTDGNYLWVGIMMNEDYSSASSVVKIDINSNLVVETYEVGLGPTSMVIDDGDIYVARTYYNDNWESFHGSSKIGSSEIIINNYGIGTACGGSIMKYSNEIYRSFDGGIASLDFNLDVNILSRIGSYDQSQVYSTEVIGDYIYFGLFTSLNTNQVRVKDFNNNEVAIYDVGLLPGDFAIWNNLEEK